MIGMKIVVLSRMLQYHRWHAGVGFYNRKIARPGPRYSSHGNLHYDLAQNIRKTILRHLRFGTFHARLSWTCARTPSLTCSPSARDFESKPKDNCHTNRNHHILAHAASYSKILLELKMPVMSIRHQVYHRQRSHRGLAFRDGIRDQSARSYENNQWRRIYVLGSIHIPGTTSGLQFAILHAYGSCSFLVP